MFPVKGLVGGEKEKKQKKGLGEGSCRHHLYYKEFPKGYTKMTATQERTPARRGAGPEGPPPPYSPLTLALILLDWLLAMLLFVSRK